MQNSKGGGIAQVRIIEQPRREEQRKNRLLDPVRRTNRCIVTLQLLHAYARLIDRGQPSHQFPIAAERIGRSSRTLLHLKQGSNHPFVADRPAQQIEETEESREGQNGKQPPGKIRLIPERKNVKRHFEGSGPRIENILAITHPKR